MPPEWLGAQIARFTIYAAVALVVALLVHALQPNASTGASFFIAFFGITVVGATRAFRRMLRRPPCRRDTKGRSPPA